MHLWPTRRIRVGGREGPASETRDRTDEPVLNSRPELSAVCVGQGIATQRAKTTRLGSGEVSSDATSVTLLKLERPTLLKRLLLVHMSSSK